MDRAEAIRVEADTLLAERLRVHPVVQAASRARGRASGGSEIERSLLATAVRLTRSVAPELQDMLASCAEMLKVETTLEPFVYPSSSMNAAVTPPEDGKLFVLFSSELLDAFDQDELCFVVGHELGHHKYGHHDIPVRAVLEEGGKQDPELALDLFSWSRFAELSADRAGLMCCNNLEAVGRSLFKLASGLRGTRANVAMQALLAQVEELQAQGIATADDADRDEWFSTHPFSPLRLKAASLAHSAGLFAGIGEDARVGLERQTHELMAVMDPGYLKGKSEEARAMRRVLLAGGFLVAVADGEVHEAEVAALDGFLGEGTVHDRLSAEALRADLPSRLADLKACAGAAHHQQVVRDICIVARADGHVADCERAVIEEICEVLQISPALVERMFGAEMQLD
jgi:tellurite resistance protein